MKQLVEQGGTLAEGGGWQFSLPASLLAVAFQQLDVLMARSC